MGFISRIEARHAEITAQIATLVTERDELDAALRVFARLGGAQESTAALKEVPVNHGEALTRTASQPMQGTEPAGTQAPPVDTIHPQPAGPAGLPEASASGQRINSVSNPEADTEGDNPALMAEVVVPAAASADPVTADQSGDEGDDGHTVETDREAGASPASRPATPGKSGEASNEASPAPLVNIKDRLRALHDAEPHLNVYGAAERLGVSPGSVRSFSTDMGLVWNRPVAAKPALDDDGPAQPQMLSLRDKVKAMHRHHPEWTARMIADAVGAKLTSVSVYLADIRSIEKEARAVA